LYGVNPELDEIGHLLSVALLAHRAVSGNEDIGVKLLEAL
jgi:hypothetical protein